MKIAIIAPGNCEQKKNWAKVLHALGHQVYWVSFDKENNLSYAKFYHLHEFKLYPYLQFFFRVRLLKKFLQKEKIDWLHAFYTTNYGILAALCCKGKFSVTAAGSDILIEPKRKPILKFINQITLSRSAFIHSASFQITEHLLHHYEKLPKIITMPEGVDIHRFAPTNKRNKKKIAIVSTRNFYPIYNQKQQAEAAVILAKKNVDFVYHFIGDGPERIACMKIIQDGGISERCIFHGRLSPEKLAAILNTSDIYVSTSLSDGTSTSFLEAMSAGVFPIVSDIPANRFWIEPERTGYLIPVNDSTDLAQAIFRAIKDDSLRKKAALINREKIIQKADLSEVINIFINEIQKMPKDGKTTDIE